MRILVHDYGGYPFSIQLSRALAVKGYTVLHAYSGSSVSPHGVASASPEDPHTLSFHQICLAKYINKQSFLKRRFQEVTYGKKLGVLISQFKPDVVISGNTPIEAQKQALRVSQRIESRFIYWLQDFYGIAAYRILKKRLPIIGWIVGHYYMYLEMNLLRKSDKIVAISDNFNELLLKRSVNPNQIKVIHNWAPLEEIPVTSKNNNWAAEHMLNEAICFLYSGTLGMKHNPDLLLQLALHFRHNNKVRIVVISEGPAADWLKTKAIEESLPNLILMPFQRYEDLPKVLASADILVAILESDASIYSVPSKVLTYLCAQRPLLLAVPQENQAARIVIKHNAGIVVPPENTEDFIKAATRLIHDAVMRDTLSNNARSYAEDRFCMEYILKDFEEILQ